MAIFNLSRKANDGYNDSKTDNTPAEQNKNSVSVNEPAEQYYFENKAEFLTYVALSKKDRDIVWLNGSDYIDEFKKGYQLYEEGRFSEAVDAYQKCLTLNPIGISARFELCEAYIRLNRLKEATDMLFKTKEYISKDADIARFYRRVGYIETEKGKLKTAAACHEYSMIFEHSSSAVNELKYIISKGGSLVPPSDIVKILTDSGIPLTKRIQSESQH